MRIGRFALIVALAVGAAGVVRGQGPGPLVTDARLLDQLKKIFPVASAFAQKDGDPPHFKVYVNDPATRTLGGYAFWTTELEPLERAYDGPIKMLVGMDTSGVLTGVLVVEHHEPYGNFSIDLPAFPRQFYGKSIRDPFRVGADVDAVSRATITVTSASRAVRNSARRIARAYLTPPDPAKP
jgi:NosR/NirI family nitrous oxide reductase transcriptional regulator